MDLELRHRAQMSSLGEQKFDLEALIRQVLAKDALITDRIQAASILAESIDEPKALHSLLTVLLHDTDARLIMHIVGLLARKRVYSAVMPLVDIVLCTGQTAIEQHDKQFSKSDVGLRVRIAAVQALGRMGDERAIVPLMSLLGNQGENYRLRLAAAESLGRLGDTQALNPLLNIVNDEQESSLYLKESAVKALGMLGDIRALDPLLEMFEAQKGIKNKFNFLKEQIVEALGRLGSNHNRAMSALLDSLEDDASSIRLSAVESLSAIGDAKSIPALKSRLFDTDDDVAVAAASALYQLGGEVLIRDILQELENLPQFIREELESYVP